MFNHNDLIMLHNNSTFDADKYNELVDHKITDLNLEIDKLKNEIEYLKKLKLLPEEKTEEPKAEGNECDTSTSIANTTNFQIKMPTYISPMQIAGFPVKEGEETLKDYAFAEIEEYSKKGLKYPPDSLKDTFLNEGISLMISEEALTPQIIVYLRFLTHPYKQTPNKQDWYYLSSLYNGLGIPFNVLNYLVSGTNISLKETEKDLELPFEYNEEESNEAVSQIENYLDMLADYIKENSQRIKIIIEKEAIDIKISRKALVFKEDLSLNYYKTYMSLWGIFMDVKKLKLK